MFSPGWARSRSSCRTRRKWASAAPRYWRADCRIWLLLTRSPARRMPWSASLTRRSYAARGCIERIPRPLLGFRLPEGAEDLPGITHSRPGAHAAIPWRGPWIGNLHGNAERKPGPGQDSAITGLCHKQLHLLQAKAPRIDCVGIAIVARLFWLLLRICLACGMPMRRLRASTAFLVCSSFFRPFSRLSCRQPYGATYTNGPMSGTTQSFPTSCPPISAERATWNCW